MSPLWIAAAYVALAAALDGPAHRIVYPLVGFGHPLTGFRRWLVRLLAPAIFVAACCVVGTVFPVLLLAVIGSSRA